MKKLSVLFTALFSLAIIFTSCEKDEPSNNNSNQFDVKVVNGNAYNSKIDSVFSYAYSYKNDEEKVYVLGKSKYTNGGFSVKLSPVPSDFLYFFPEDEGEITVSDKTAKFFLLDEEESFIAKKNGKTVGAFFCSNISLEDILNNETEGMPVGGGMVYYMYVDKDIKITGTITYEADEYGNPEEKDYYNLSLKTGWNAFVYKLKNKSETLEEYEYTTAENTANYKWYFFED